MTRALSCGCNARRGCSLGDLLFRCREWRRLAKHLEQALTKTRGASQAEHEARRQKRRRAERRLARGAA